MKEYKKRKTDNEILIDSIKIYNEKMKILDKIKEGQILNIFCKQKTIKKKEQIESNRKMNNKKTTYEKIKILKVVCLKKYKDKIIVKHKYITTITINMLVCNEIEIKY